MALLLFPMGCGTKSGKITAILVSKKYKPLKANDLKICCVRLKGLEPSRRKAPDPKSGASANSATSAFFKKRCKFTKKNQICKLFIDYFSFLFTKGG